MPTLRWFGAWWVTSFPSMATVPAVGRSKPAIMRNVVVLPQPDGPRNETNSPRSAARSKCWTAATSPNRFWMPLSSRKAMGLVVSLASAGDRDSAARTAPEQRDEAHGDPRQPEADQGDRGLLVRGDISQLREVDREDLAGKESRDRELADHDGEGQEGSAQQRDPQVRQDDLDQDPQPAGAEALGGLGQALDVHRPQARVDRPVHVRERQHDVTEDEERRAPDVGVGERQRRAAERADEAEHEDDRWDDERQEGDELDVRSSAGQAEPDPERGRDQQPDADDDRDEPDDEGIAQAREELRVREDRRVRRPGRHRSKREGERPDERQEEVGDADDEDGPPRESQRGLALPLHGWVERLALPRLDALTEPVGAAVRHRSQRSERRCRN